MFDIGWSEIMVIIAVAVIVVGPKDIPKMLRSVGKYIRKAKSMMRDFQNQIEEVADISELKELKAEADKLKNFDLEKTIGDMDSATNTPKDTETDTPQTDTSQEESPLKEPPKSKTTTKPKAKMVKSQ